MARATKQRPPWQVSRTGPRNPTQHGRFCAQGHEAATGHGQDSHGATTRARPTTCFAHRATKLGMAAWAPVARRHNDSAPRDASHAQGHDLRSAPAALKHVTYSWRATPDSLRLVTLRNLLRDVPLVTALGNLLGDVLFVMCSLLLTQPCCTKTHSEEPVASFRELPAPIAGACMQRDASHAPFFAGPRCSSVALRPARCHWHRVQSCFGEMNLSKLAFLSVVPAKPVLQSSMLCNTTFCHVLFFAAQKWSKDVDVVHIDRDVFSATPLKLVCHTLRLMPIVRVHSFFFISRSDRHERGDIVGAWRLGIRQQISMLTLSHQSQKLPID